VAVTAFSHAGHILVVEDDAALAAAIVSALSREGHQVDSVGTGRELRAYLDERVPELVLLDLHLPDASGLDLLPVIKEAGEMVSVVVITGDREISTVVEAMRRGADHFLPKPFDLATLCEEAAKTLRHHRLRRRASVYQERVAQPRGRDPLPDLVGSSAAIGKVRELACQVADTDASVVLLGESGTGKGMIARGIHQLSRRAGASFVGINCASLQPQLLESEIFGYEKGAFTGAASRKPGLMEVADGGTLFLDEIAEMESQAQGKLLTALESRSFRRVGGIKEIRVDVRFIVATHHDLEDEVGRGGFRADLYYRLDVFQIRLPPLRERLEDLPELSVHFIRSLNPTLGRQVESIAPRTMDLLTRYHWPGNVRELRNVIERAMILTSGSDIRPEHLPTSFKTGAGPEAGPMRALAEVEREHIERVLIATRRNIQRTARVLGISRSTLYAKMKQYKLNHEDIASKR